MEWPDVERRIAAGEDAHTEFKRGSGDLRGIGKSLCAFANGDGGLIVIGVDDATRTVVGVDADPEAMQERLTSLLHTGCDKPVTAQCGRHDTGSGGSIGLTSIAINGATSHSHMTADSGFGAAGRRSRRLRPRCRS